VHVFLGVKIGARWHGLRVVRCCIVVNHVLVHRLNYMSVNKNTKSRKVSMVRVFNILA